MTETQVCKRHIERPTWIDSDLGKKSEKMTQMQEIHWNTPPPPTNNRTGVMA